MIEFRQDALDEVVAATEWYVQRSFRAAKNFNDRLDQVIADVESDPERFPRIHLDFRFVRILRFPYVVIFQIRMNLAMVLAVAHSSRRDHYWLERE